MNTSGALLLDFRRLDCCLAGSELATYRSLGFKFRVGLGNSFFSYEIRHQTIVVMNASGILVSDDYHA